VSLACAVLVGSPAWAAVTIEICTSWDSTGAMISCKDVDAAVVGTDNMSGAKILDGGSGNAAEIATKTSYPGHVPAGWTNPTGGLAVPPSTATQTVSYQTPSGALFSSKAAACTAWGGAPSACGGNGTTAVVLQAPGDANPGTIGGTNTSGADRCLLWCDQTSPYADGALSTATVSAVPSCPAGYTVSGANCNLSNAALVMKPSDGKCGVIRSGNTITNDSRDPDCTGSGSAATALSLTASGGVASASSGGKTLEVVIDSTTGNVTIMSSSPNTGGDTSTTASVGIIGTGGSSGQVSGKATTITQGTGTLNDTTKTATTAACGGPGQPGCVIDATGMPTAADMTAAQTAVDAAGAAHVAAIAAVDASVMEAHETTLLSYFTGIGAIAWPSGACVNPTIGISGHTGTVPLCEHSDDVKAGMGWLFGVLSAFSCAFAALRAIKGT